MVQSLILLMIMITLTRKEWPVNEKKASISREGTGDGICGPVQFSQSESEAATGVGLVWHQLRKEC